ncbi:hypothetical protein DPMN_030267 [Dreissena polymorpha]|uniref:Uncharacterized protein n=1 Tax=Dreissena polymorpha TaxID=45954 RepID=A0A9D4LXV8_DREPO|nr:hypothetical protein DPMN_030267 [Dreissena polymorpha]
MPDLFNIDLAENGFRKNNLDWRKFRDTYNKVSATKLERGIKPLPLSLLLKLFGPQKVFRTYVISHHEGELDDSSFRSVPDLNISDASMKPGEAGRDALAVTKTVSFPGSGLLTHSTDDLSGKHKTSKIVKRLKRDGLPTRPAFQRGLRVPGRYFPKPVTNAGEDNLNHSTTFVESPLSRERDRDNRPWTQTPRAINVATPSSLRSQQTFSRNSSRLFKGTACKPSDTMFSSTRRTPTWSGKSNATMKSMPPFNTNGVAHFRRGNGFDDPTDANPGASFKLEIVNCNGNGNHAGNHTDLSSELSISKRIRYSARQVSFPKTSTDFTTVLQGRPKTLHSRDLAESLETNVTREPRARTHVGFVDNT